MGLPYCPLLLVPIDIYLLRYRSEPDNGKRFLGPNFVNIADSSSDDQADGTFIPLQLGLKKPLRYFVWSDSTSYTSYGR